VCARARARLLASSLRSPRDLPQSLLIIGRSRAIPIFPFLQSRRDDLQPWVDFAVKNQRRQSATIVSKVLALLLLKSGAEKINRQLKLSDQLGFCGMARLADDCPKCINILVIKAIQLGDQDIDGVRDDEGAIAQDERSGASAPMRAGSKV